MLIMLEYHDSSVEDTTAIATVAIFGILVAVILIFCVASHRGFTRSMIRSRAELKPDECEASRLPLPPGSLGLPMIGEMAQFIVEVCLMIISYI